MRLGSNCILQTPLNAELLEKLLPQVPSDERYIAYSSILPYLADYMNQHGMIVPGIDNNPASITDKVEENLNSLKDYTKTLISIWEGLYYVDLPAVDNIVYNKTTDPTNYSKLLNYYGLVDNDISDGTNSYLSWDLKFQLLLKVTQGKLTQGDLNYLGYTNKKQFIDSFLSSKGYKAQYTYIVNNQEQSVGARNIHQNNTILINLPTLSQLYSNKAWKNPRNSKPLNYDFKSFDEFLQFTMLHEIAHDSILRQEGESKQDYETRVNQAALEQLTPSNQSVNQETTTEQPIENDGGINLDTPPDFDPTKVTTSPIEQVKPRTNIVYNTEFTSTPLNIQLDDVKFKMSVQDKRTALDIIADSFYRTVNTVLEKSEEKIKQEARERNITPARRRVQIARSNKEIFSSIEKENAFKNADKKFIQKLQSQFIPLSELDVIKAYGVNNIVSIIKNALQNNPRTSIIAENFDALLRQASSKINQIYGINILGNTELFDDDNESEENSNDQSNTDANNTESKEDFTHADDKTRASERSLSKELKLAYRQCFVTNEKGRVLTNNFGYKTPIDISAAHNKVLHLLEGIIDVNDVIPMLQRSQEGWVKQFIIKLQKNPRLLSQLYFCCKLSAQDYRIVYYKDGKLIQSSINRLSQIELVANETTSNITNGILQTNKKDSIYNSKGEVNKEGVKNTLSLIDNTIKDVVNTDDIYSIESLDNNIRQIFRALGITIPTTYNLQESIALYNPDNNKAGLIALLNHAKNFCNQISKKEVIDTKDNYLNQIFTFIGKSDVGYVESSVTENGKSYYTYSKTNYIDELLLHLKQSVKGKKTSTGEDYYSTWRDNQFGQSAFFKNPLTQKWYSDWMSKLFNPDSKYNKYRDLIARCSVLYTKDNLGRKTEFTAWDDVESMTTNYAMYKEANPNLNGQKLESNEKAAWYRMPIASDSNASDYIQFVRYVSTSDVSYDTILDDKFWDICQQELVRISEVENHLNQKLRGEHTSADIKGYDAEQKNGIITDAGGLVFTLLPQLNYVKIDPAQHSIFNKIKPEFISRFEGVSFLNAIRTLSSQVNNFESTIVTEPITMEDLKQFFLQVFHNVAEADFNREFDSIQSKIGGEIERANYREYYYNYMYAWIQMVELTSTDTAFFGKRKVKEVNSAKQADFTHKYNVVENGEVKSIIKHYKIISDDTLSTFQKRNKEYHAPTNKVALSKPYFREVYLEDDEIHSEIALNAINAIKNNPNLGPKAKDRLINAYLKNVNVADGQSYRSLESYMELLDAQGLLNDEQKEAFARIIHQHTWDEGDVNLIALAIKPYFYSVVPQTRSTINQTGDRNIVLTPTQHKNSELPLTAALGAISASLNNSNALQAMNEFMSNHNIDVIHFNSVVKVGESGTINGINYEDLTKSEILDKLEKACGFDTNIKGNPEVVHEVPTSSWGIQLNKPEHLLDAQQLIGSQIRRLILADLPNDPDYRINIPRFDENGKLYYDSLSVNEFKQHYQDLITTSLIEDFASVDEIFKDPKQLEAFLQESIASSTKYDEDLLEMFTWDAENNRFKIPFWNRTVANRVEEILLALIKNRIGKQKIAGGAAVQTAAVGLSKELNVRYQKNGKVLDTYREYTEKNPQASAKDYEQYTNGATLAYMEVYLPMWSRDMVEALTDENGTLHYENLPEQLKYMVGYRIPTEDHYSCAPLYVKGFLPNLNASTIVVPADITTIAGSDFDIDVMYLMRHEFTVTKYDEEALKADYAKAKDKYDAKNTDIAVDKLLGDIFGVDKTTLTPKFVNYQRWRNKHIWDLDKNGNRKYLLPKDQWKLEKVKYDYTKPDSKQSRKARNNEFIDTIIGCLQSPHSLDKFTNIGNYDELKIASRICEILTHPSNTSSLTTLKNKTLDELNDIVAELNKEKNLASPQIQTDLHQQNMAGNQLKGIFVAAKSLQEVLQHTPISVNSRFTINGNESTKDSFILGKMRAADKTLITKRFASYVAAAVDNGKDPLMNALKVSPKNAGVVNYLTMLGYSPLEIGLFLNCVDINNSLSLKDDEAKRIKAKYKEIYEYSALSLNIMSWAIQNRSNVNTDERVQAVALIAADTYKKVKSQSNLLSTLAKGLRADSLNFKKSIPENLQLMFALEEFEKTNNGKSPTFSYSKLPIKGAEITTNITSENIQANCDMSILPYLQGFTDCLFSASTAWMNPYTLYTKGRMLDIIKAINRSAGSLAPKMITDFIDAYQRVSLLKLPLFGTDDQLTLSQKREYLVHDFPKEFAKFKQHLPEELRDNLFIDNIILVQPNRFDSNFHLEVKELGKNKDIRAKFKADCDKLAAYNPDIAKKLFLYTTFRNGFGYSQMGWAHLTSINFQENLAGYVDTLYDMGDIDNNFIQNLFVQFLKNNCEKYSNIFKKEQVDNFNIANTTGYDDSRDDSDILFISDEKYGRAVSFDSGNTWTLITNSLGAKDFYHEYFRAEDTQVSIFKDSDKNVESDETNYYDPLEDVAYNDNSESELEEKNDSKSTKEQLKKVDKENQKGEDGIPRC